MIRLTEEQGKVVLNYLQKLQTMLPIPENSGTLEEVLLQLSQQVRDYAENGNSERTLIDTIASFIGDQDAPRLNGDILHALRNALLSPKEWRKLDALRDNRDCSRCGHRFSTAELAVLMGDKFVCFTCTTPYFYACKVCKSGVVRITNKLLQVMMARSCGCRTSKAKVAEENDTNYIPPTPLPTPRIPENFIWTLADFPRRDE